MVMKRFEIIEKLYLSKALLKMAGGGDASPTPPLDPPLHTFTGASWRNSELSKLEAKALL